jgi:polyhydroxyalkanoate synthesis repressor PhaR
MPETRVIKRYSNRKLYDTSNSRYVTLEQIGEMVRAGEEVKIVDNASKEDLTSVTLAQIIFEEEKKKKSFLPLGALRSILQSGGEQLSEFARTLKAGAGRIKIIRGKDSKDPEAEALPEESEPIDIDEPDFSLESNEEKHFFRGIIDGSQRAFDEVQRRVDERIKAAIFSLTEPLAALQHKLTDLNRRLESMERRLTEISGPEARKTTHEKTEAEKLADTTKS